MISVLMRQFVQFARRLASSSTAHLSRFAADTRAGALIYVTATLPVIVGFSLLAIDGSRLWSMHTSLQKAADALAIAAAAELDRFPQAIDRAEIAVVNLVENRQFMGTGAGSIIGTALSAADIQTRYFSSLPSTDDISMDTLTPLTKNDADAYKTARFVEVIVQPRSMNTIFPASFLGGSNIGTAAAVAVAGNDQVVCKLMPLFICNPYELSGNTDILDPSKIEDCANDVTCRRKQILMRAGPKASGGGGGNGGGNNNEEEDPDPTTGNSSAYFPGNFGFLDVGAGGANALSEALAVGSPEQCFLQNGVQTEPGEMTGPVENGINVRFGLVPNGFMPSLSPSMYPPDLNVRKAQKQTLAANKICINYEPISDTDPSQGQTLPKDDCFLTDPHSCDTSHFGRLGDAGWEARMAGYWQANFGQAVPHPGTILGYNVDNNGVVTDDNGNVVNVGWNNVTRYDVYNYEISAGKHLVTAPNGNPETGLAGTCHPNAGVQDRRIVNGAIINCLALEAAGFKLSGTVPNIPVVAFAEFFVLEPLRQNTPNPDDSQAIYSELVRVVKQGHGGIATSLDQVQLYR